MNAVVPPPTNNPVRRLLLPLFVVAAFIGGFLIRGAGPSSPRPSASVPVPRPEERRAVPDLEHIGRYVGVVADIGPDAVVVMAPDRPSPDAKQHPVTLRVTARTRINSLLGKDLLPGQFPEDGGEPATLREIKKDDLVGFTGGSPYTDSAFDAETITIVGRIPPH